MKSFCLQVSLGTLVLCAVSFGARSPVMGNERYADLVKAIREHHSYSAEELQRLEAILKASGTMTQGHPAVSRHPMDKAECVRRRAGIQALPDEAGFAGICGARAMAPLYDPAKEKATDARVCVDQFEFPNIACEYPLVWVKAVEAQQICKAIGKRLCDAQEWEDSCAGAARPIDYVFSSGKISDDEALRLQRRTINARRKKVWAYGDKQNHGLCASGSAKSPGCDKALASGADVYKNCGSNTYPAGAFPECRSKLGVYDQHGNAAEHMNLPLTPEQLTRNGGTGHVEMKGSWFIFQKISAHEDDCLWRAPYWHGTPLMSSHSHANYHLGFRCCKDVVATDLR